MSVKASGRIAFSKVPSVESETRYFLLTESSSIVPSKPTTVPPTGGWTQTEPTYSDNSATSTLYTCVLTQFTNDTFAYSEVSISSAYEAAKEAYNKAQQVADTVDGLTLIQDGKVVIDGGKVYANDAFIQSIFAQDITATGTITGAKLIGAILSGENINIVSERVYDDTDEDGLLYQRIYTQTVIKTVQEQNGVDYLLLKQASVTDDYNDNPPVAANTPYRTNVQYGDGSYIKLTNDELFVYTPQITTNSSVKSYTSFSGGVVSDGTAVVTQKLGMCFINAGITLTGPVSGWTTLLDSSKVPGPQNGTAIYATLPSWKAPTTNPARLRIPVGGGLQINRGSANAFWINLAYPIE